MWIVPEAAIRDLITPETSFAALQQRGFDRVIGWNLPPGRMVRLANVAAEVEVPFGAVGLDRLRVEADVIITFTSSFAPILLAAQLVTDEIAPSVTLGECQHEIAAGLIRKGEIGAVVNGTHPGRLSDDAITLFDGTGVRVQDLVVAAAVIDLAIARGTAVEVDF